MDEEIEVLKKQLAKLEHDKEVQNEKKELLNKIDSLKKGQEPDSKIKRMGRGFKYMFGKLKDGYQSIASSDYVQNIKAEQDRGTDPDAYMAIMPGEESPKKKSKIKVRKEEDPFATDLGNITQTDF